MIAMLFPTMVSTAEYTDVVDTKYEIPADLLSRLKIIEGFSDGSFNVNGTMTRAEFAVILSKLSAASNLVSDKVYFLDVPESYWARKAINDVVAQGLMESDGKYFRPDDNLTEQDLSKSLVTLLGYSEYAKHTSYSVVAASLGIYKGIKIGKNITRGDVLLAVYNAIHIDAADLKTITSDGNYQVEIRKDSTILTKNFNLYKTKGQITAVGNIDLVRNVNSRSNYVRIDDVLYELDEELELDDSLIGRTGTFFYYSDKKSSVPVLKYFILNENDEIIEVRANDINISDSSLIKLSYYDERGNNLEEKISLGARFIVNGQLIADQDKNDNLFNIESGLVRMIIPSDGSNEIVWIENYHCQLVEAVGSNKLYLENGEQLDLDEERDDMKVSFYTATGDVTTFSSIVSKSAVAIADVKAVDGILYRSVYILKSVIGTPTEVSTDYIVMDDKEYSVIRNFDSSKLDLKKQYIFYLTLDGEIALYRESTHNQVLYGYLIGAGLSKGLTNDLQFKILVANGEKKIFSADDVLYVNDIRVHRNRFTDKDDNPIYTYLIDAATDRTKRQVIIYEEDEKGQITRIYTPFPKEVEDAVLKIDYPLARKQCKSGSIFNFGGELTLRNTGVIFAVPSNPDTAHEDDFEVWPIAYFVNDQSYDVEGYNMNELCEAEIIKVVLSNTDAANYNESNTYTCIFDKKTKVLDEKGRETYAITYWQQGAKYTKTIADRGQKQSYLATLETVAEIRRGDCFKIELTADNSQIKNMSIEFKEAQRNVPNASYNYGRLMFYGRVEAVGANSIVIRQFVDDPQRDYVLDTCYLFKNAGRVSTYLYTRADKPIEYLPNCLADVRVGDWVLFQARNAAPRVMVIYRDDSKLPNGKPIY